MNSIVRHMPDATALQPDFRSAMRQLVGGVSVITVGRGDEVTGMTVSSLSSLAVDPPSIIVSLNRNASSWPILQRERVFGANLLAADQIGVAERFAGKGGLRGAERFAGAEWRKHVTGVPLLVGALATLDCEVEEIIERHSHAIVIGKVVHIDVAPQSAALAYWHGSYVGVDREDDLGRLAAFSVPDPRLRP
ncbi:putative NAD(P)H-flavin oxidoreductase containing a FMN-binding domain [Bradyrhizobium sp. ORS 285]|uniref:flavin reductase family protein n=1 Tax=Bradyrhizobium sp. ORS 285 TaxID=115808 RepID=UPI0002406E0C|nr:flavin reductase family protein [Bradyrhizobium sp. ORS 285]CCD89585.1 putative NAD(P)H-flavin oxidoreductase containing a FMN-binding domain [Bradyrhizobium sp. ORS 285]SMX56264.1 putative NAD(P)H-flavin oxidoreductase containing a FMN-binding domain [Bradyrhizobium sp. ORS 285]